MPPRCRSPAFSMICIPPRPGRSRWDPASSTDRRRCASGHRPRATLKLRVFADSNPATVFTTYPMTLDPASGIWSYTAPTASLYGKYYLYEAQVFVRATNRVETNVVTDPYSVSLARNSTRSQIVSLEDSELAAARLGQIAQAASGRARRHRAVRTARARFQRHRRDRPRGQARHVRGVHAEALGWHEAPGDAGPGGRHACAPAAVVRLRDHQRGQVHVGVALVRHARELPGRFSRAAGAGRGHRGPRRLTTGATTRCTTTCPRAATRPMPTVPRASSNSARWCSR